ncbi:MAG: TraL conjugative transposon family protein [Alistipes sp.]|jgi:hypothetical protein|nr:TraL conjugative transposon family protein [Alistipes sp.]
MNRRQEERNRAGADCRSAKEENERSEVRKPFESLREMVETSLRRICGRVSPDRRAVVIVAMLVLFAALNLWITARAIWSIGRENAPPQQIEIPLKESNEQQLLNPNNYDNTNIEQDQGER